MTVVGGAGEGVGAGVGKGAGGVGSTGVVPGFGVVGLGVVGDGVLVRDGEGFASVVGSRSREVLFSGAALFDAPRVAGSRGVAREEGSASLDGVALPASSGSSPTCSPTESRKVLSPSGSTSGPSPFPAGAVAPPASVVGADPSAASARWSAEKAVNGFGAFVADAVATPSSATAAATAPIRTPIRLVGALPAGPWAGTAVVRGSAKPAALVRADTVPSAAPAPSPAAAAGACPPASSRAEVANAAPRATDALGSTSMARGRSNSSDRSWATSGMRDDPPMSRIALSSSARTPALSRAARRVTSVSARAGSIIASNSDRTTRTCEWAPGSITETVASESEDSASLASAQSFRRRVSAARTSGAGSRSVGGRSALPRTWSKISWSKSAPPSRSIPCGVPRTAKVSASVFRSTVASKVPPPRS